MDTGKSLRVMQAKFNLSNKALAKNMGEHEPSISRYRKSKIMSGAAIIAFSDYFGVACWEFIKMGEEK